MTGTFALAFIQRNYDIIAVIKDKEGRLGGGRDSNIATKKWTILTITNNRVKDWTRTVAVAPIQRYDDAVTVTRSDGRTTGVGEIERTTDH